MEAGHRHFWTLGRKLGLAAWAYIASILVNLAMTSICLLLYFRPAFDEAQSGFQLQQRVETVRSELRRCHTLAESGPAGGRPSPELAASLSSVGDAIQALRSAEAAGTLELHWDDLPAMDATAPGRDHPQAPRTEAPIQTNAQMAQWLAAADRVLSDAISVLSDRRQESTYEASEAQHWILQILAANLCIGGLLCVLGLWFARMSVTRPVGVLRETTARIGRGDFDVRLDLGRTDELGRLADQINRMADRLKSLQQHLVDRERQAAGGDMVEHLERSLGGPLAEIQAVAGGELVAQADDHEASESQRQIMDTVSRLQAWLHALRSSFALSASQARPVVLAQVVSDALAAVRPTLERHQVQTAVELDPGISEVCVDRLQFEQALVALVTNAAEASRPGQVVRISAKVGPQVDGCWELSVEDQGCGISAELMERIFLPFFTTKRDGNGIGLGLVRAIIRQHGGELLVTSTPGAGSRFTIHMPQALPANAGG